MMRMIRPAAALVVALATVALGAQPAVAGNWATTVFDPTPTSFETGKSYTIGFWVLQHGSHPYSGVLDPVGLKLVDTKGGTTFFGGTPLTEPAHFATAIHLPAAGTFNVFGVQGPFQDYKIGTLTVPGGLTVLPVPPPAALSDAQPWREIRPPNMPVDPNRGPFDQEATVPAEAPADAAATRTAPAAAADAADAAAADDTAATRPASSSVRPVSVLAVLMVLAVLVLAAVVGLLLYRRRRPNSTRTSDPAPGSQGPAMELRT
jgi:hypothetical protein